MSTIKSAVLDAVLAALPVAVVYFSGWAYLSSYLGLFGVDATQVEIPITTVLVYAFIPLNSWQVLAYLAFAALVGFAVSLIRNPAKWIVNLSVLAGTVAVILLLFIVKHAAEQRAIDMAEHVWQGQKSHTIVVLKPSGGQDAARAYYERCVEGRRLRQIIGLRETLYLLCRSSVLPSFHGVMFVITEDQEIAYYAERNRSNVGASQHVED